MSLSRQASRVAFPNIVAPVSTVLALSVFAFDRHRVAYDRQRPTARRHTTVHRNCHNDASKSHRSLVAQRRLYRHDLRHTSATSSISGAPITYTAPATAFNPSTVTLTATVSNTSRRASATVKFTVPTVANGKAYVGTRGNNTGGADSSPSVPGELEVYGLLPN